MSTRLTLMFRQSLAATLLLGALASGQNAGPPQAALASNSNAGVVVDEVRKGSNAEQAGLQVGDVLLKWNRAEASGRFESSFDVSYVDVEQSPRGSVVVEGLRGTEAHNWRLSPNVWRFKARPQLSAKVLSDYLEAQKISESHPADAAQRLIADVAQLQSPSNALIRCWLLFRAAGLLVIAKDSPGSDSAYQHSLDEAAELGPVVRAQVLEAWGDAFRKRSEWDRSEHCLKQAVEEGQKIAPDSLFVANNLTHVGYVRWQRGDLSGAQEYFERTIAIDRKYIPESPEMAADLLNYGNLALGRGDFEQAEQLYRQVLAIGEKVHRPDRVAYALNNLGVIFEERGDLEAAEKYLLDALARKQSFAPKTIEIADNMDALGVVARKRGDLARADKYFHDAFALKQEIAPDSLDLARSLSGLGVVAEDRGQLETAENYFRQAAAIYEKLAPETLNASEGLHQLGDVARDRGDVRKAEELYTHSLAIRERLAPASLDTAADLSALGDLAYQRDDLVRAEDDYRKALEIRTKLAPGSSATAESLASIGKVMRRRGKAEVAADLYEQALNALEIQIAHLGGTDEIRSGFRARHESYFRDYIDLLVTLGRPEHAVDILERSRARSLLELLRQAHVDFRQGIDPQLLAQERSLRDAIQAKTESRIDLLAEQQTAAEAARIRKELEALVEQYKDVEDRIRAASPRYAALTQPRPLSARQIQQQLLDPDTVLLEYSMGEDRSFVFAITSTSLSSYELPKRSRLEAEGRRVYELLTARSQPLNPKEHISRTAQIVRADSEFTKAATALSALVLAPVAKELHHKRLVIVSDGVLHYIPFAALPDPTANHSRSMKPLVVDHEIVNLPSASVLALLREQDRGHPSYPGKIAVLADPVFAKSDPRVRVNSRRAGVVPATFTEVTNASSSTREAYPDELTRSANDVLGSSEQVRLPRLLFTREEAEAIAGAASPRKVLKALDFDASRATAQNPALKQYRTVHFATHGLIDTEHPELSGLVLSLVNKDGQAQNGFLDLDDIYNLNLPVHLVVLSACKTALGKQVDGEGLIGLTRGFMYAGSPRIVASLWTVSDVATARLMSLFYKAMERDGMSAAAALRTAQVQLWKTQRWSSPYYWGAFQMQGDWK